MANGENSGRDPDLRPLIARLKEIERKCESMGTRNEEFPMMKDKLTSIVGRLEAGEEPTGEPLAYRQLARELFPIAHLFESVGFMSVGKEIAHVERALRELEPETASPEARTAPVRPASTTTGTTAPTPESEIDGPADGQEVVENEEREGIPKPILAGTFILIVAVAMAAAVILEIGPFEPKEISTPVPPTATTVPSPTPQPPSPTRAPHDPNATPTTRERFLEALSQARLALRDGEVEEAMKYLSIAALTDRHDNSVIEVAGGAVDQLLQNANAAAAEGRWEDAAAFTAEARTVATRFSLGTRRIDAAEQQFAEMERYRIVEPGDIEAVRAAIGERVEIHLDDGSMLVGQITSVSGSELVLEVEDDVGGGIVSFTDEVPLSTIRWIRIWED